MHRRGPLLSEEAVQRRLSCILWKVCSVDHCVTNLAKGARPGCSLETAQVGANAVPHYKLGKLAEVHIPRRLAASRAPRHGWWSLCVSGKCFMLPAVFGLWPAHNQAAPNPDIPHPVWEARHPAMARVTAPARPASMQKTSLLTVERLSVQAPTCRNLKLAAIAVPRCAGDIVAYKCHSVFLER